MTDWFRALTTILNRHEPAADARALPRAAAALLLEMAVTDQGASADELALVHEAMRRTFALDPAELDALLDEAHQAQAEAVSLYEFTREIKAGLDTAQRAELVEWMWRVALADERLCMHEEHLVRRVADLLGVPHHEMMRRKLRAAGG